MQNLKTYGKAPFNIAVVHGGPGGAGEMAPVAKELCPNWGVLEPPQTANSLPGQVEELKEVLTHHADGPAILLGYSWGAWLVVILAAQHPDLVKKLLLIGSGPFEAKYAETIMPTRLSRLPVEERKEMQDLLVQLENPEATTDSQTLTRLGQLSSRADNYDPLPSHDIESYECQTDIYRKVWPQAAELRRSGKLLELAGKIQCPVVAIHGDYDPHPAEGVATPLAGINPDFRLVLLENCGHTPWLERQAKDRFYEIIREELR
jgi:pimeloyl-ACP methyl ester carboxylesterase